MADALGFSSAVIVAGGSGRRMGRPKQLLPLGGKPVLVHTIEAFKQVPFVRQIVVVTPPENQGILKKYFSDLVFALPGETRLESVKNGVACVDKKAVLIAVHDGARPLVSAQKITDCLHAAKTYGAAVLAVPVKDTVKTGADGFVTRTLDRSSLWAAQTPQTYQRDILERALAQFGSEKEATDESQLVEKTGVKVRLVPSDYKNNKITTPEDLVCAEAWVGAFSCPISAEGSSVFAPVWLPVWSPVTSPLWSPVCFPLSVPSSEPPVPSPDPPVSSRDCPFPPTDPSIKGICSVDIAKKVLAVMREHGAALDHIDATLITEEPKIKPHYEAVRRSLARVFEMPLERVSFKAKSHEKVGEIGRGEAAMCQAVATLKIRQ